MEQANDYDEPCAHAPTMTALQELAAAPEPTATPKSGHGTKLKRSKDACDICKSQKKGCSKEKPACTRCVRLKHDCSYETAKTAKAISNVGKRNPVTATRTRSVSVSDGTIPGSAQPVTISAAVSQTTSPPPTFAASNVAVAVNVAHHPPAAQRAISTSPSSTTDGAAASAAASIWAAIDSTTDRANRSPLPSSAVLGSSNDFIVPLLNMSPPRESLASNGLKSTNSQPAVPARYTGPEDGADWTTFSSWLFPNSSTHPDYSADVRPGTETLANASQNELPSLQVTAGYRALGTADPGQLYPTSLGSSAAPGPVGHHYSLNRLSHKDILLHMIPFMVSVGGSPRPIEQYSRWLHCNLPPNEVLATMSRTFALAFIGMLWKNVADFQSVMRALPPEYTLDDSTLLSLHEEARHMTPGLLSEAITHAESLLGEHLSRMDGPVSHKLLSLDLLRSMLWIAQGGSSFLGQLEHVEALLLTCFVRGSTLDLARLDEVDQFCMVNYIHADITRSVTHGISTLFSYAFDGDDTMPGRDCVGLEYMNGAPNIFNVALSRISNLAVTIKQSASSNPHQTMMQCIAENPQWTAQLQNIEKDVRTYCSRLTWVSEDSMVNMANLAIQEIWRQTTWIHYHQALYGRGPHFPAIKSAVRTNVDLISSIIPRGFPGAFHGRLALPLLLTAGVALETSDREKVMAWIVGQGDGRGSLEHAELIRTAWKQEDATGWPVDWRTLVAAGTFAPAFF